MIVSDLKRYLIQRRRVAMADLVVRFDVEPDAMREMMQIWVRKGRVRRLRGGPGDAACGTCTSCSENVLEIYEWVK